MSIWKQCSDEHKTTPKTGSERQTVTLTRDNRHLLQMVVNDHSASSRYLAERWSTATGALISTSSIRERLLHPGLNARVSIYGIHLTANHGRLCLQWAHEHRANQTDRYQVVFLEESRFNFCDHYGCIRARRYAGQCYLLEYFIERHSDLISGVMVWGVISYQGQSNLQRIESNLYNTRYVRDVVQPEVVPLFQGIPKTIFQQVKHAHMLQRLLETSIQSYTCNFFLGQLIRWICRLLITC